METEAFEYLEMNSGNQKLLLEFPCECHAEEIQKEIERIFLEILREYAWKRA